MRRSHRIGELVVVHHPHGDADVEDDLREQLAEGVDLLTERRLLLVFGRLLHVCHVMEATTRM